VARRSVLAGGLALVASACGFFGRDSGSDVEVDDVPEEPPPEEPPEEPPPEEPPPEEPPPEEPLVIAIVSPAAGTQYCGVPLSDDPDYEPSCTVDGPDIDVTGTVTAGATVTLNGVSASVDGSTWRATVPLDVGQNTLVAVAVRDGEREETSLTVDFVEMERSDF
jgi:hypothetical protein